MADEDKPIKYMRYAIGEVILVVIGILVAIQLDSLHKEQDNRNTEKKVLQTLREELQKDSIDLSRLIEIKGLQLTKTVYMQSFFAHPDKSIKDTALFFQNMIRPYYFYMDNPNNTAFETAKASGSLFMLANDGLVAALSSYFSDSNLSQFLSETKNFSTKHMDVFLRKYRFPIEIMNPSNDIYQAYEGAPFPFQSYIFDFEIENYYAVLTTHLNIGIGLSQDKKNRAIELIAMIEGELLGIK